jgi:hypothetical protein
VQEVHEVGDEEQEAQGGVQRPHLSTPLTVYLYSLVPVQREQVASGLR